MLEDTCHHTAETLWCPATELAPDWGTGFWGSRGGAALRILRHPEVLGHPSSQVSGSLVIDRPPIPTGDRDAAGGLVQNHRDTKSKCYGDQASPSLAMPHLPAMVTWSPSGPVLAGTAHHFLPL